MRFISHTENDSGKQLDRENVHFTPTKSCATAWMNRVYCDAVPYFSLLRATFLLSTAAYSCRDKSRTAECHHLRGPLPTFLSWWVTHWLNTVGNLCVLNPSLWNHAAGQLTTVKNKPPLPPSVVAITQLWATGGPCVPSEQVMGFLVKRSCLFGSS